MLLHQPTPDAVTNIEVECGELAARAGAEAIVVSPSPQNRIEFLEKLRQRPERVSAVGTRYAWTDPFHSGSFLSRTASQRPVKSQQAKRLDH